MCGSVPQPCSSSPACSTEDLIWFQCLVTFVLFHVTATIFSFLFFPLTSWGRSFVCLCTFLGQSQRMDSNPTAQWEPSCLALSFIWRDLPSPQVMIEWGSSTFRDCSGGSYPLQTLIKCHFDETVIITYLVNRNLTCSRIINLHNTVLPFGETGRGLVLTYWVLRGW